jgi:hypothetical protein
MSFTLYDALVPSWQQMLGAVANLLDIAQTHCTEKGLPESDLIEARLADDMFPLGFQIRSVVAHSVGAIEGVRRGVFSPDRSPWASSFAELKEQIAAALLALQQIDPAEVNGFIGRDMRFEAGERRMDFFAEDFLLSFSQPNFFFHAATAYDILRNQGLAIGKRDFMGRPRLKTPPF